MTDGYWEDAQRRIDEIVDLGAASDLDAVFDVIAAGAAVAEARFKTALHMLHTKDMVSAVRRRFDAEALEATAVCIGMSAIRRAFEQRWPDKDFAEDHRTRDDD